eukprot:CAMPEP_0202826924 /NCGR_PEP_ID=MMETSP1389-20130828/13929_1 /ASSEMBLY_ACC=CAM_ASM_000865 /TAXON_ID=302021 /ORGANISM="Rhodomonas sp., Strain CCMP768" /LENGTH=114 /DNA_ID=CAMNT_0049500269 /DNA_START=70 /DNA_END=410 /DNA_ORIENTATION=-
MKVVDCAEEENIGCSRLGGLGRGCAQSSGVCITELRLRLAAGWSLLSLVGKHCAGVLSGGGNGSVDGGNGGVDGGNGGVDGGKAASEEAAEAVADAARQWRRREEAAEAAEEAG